MHDWIGCGNSCVQLVGWLSNKHIKKAFLEKTILMFLGKPLIYSTIHSYGN